MANMREVNKAIKAAHPELKVEAVRGNGYVYFDGEGFDAIPSIMSSVTSTSTSDMVRMCIEAVNEYAEDRAAQKYEEQLEKLQAATKTADCAWFLINFAPEFNGVSEGVICHYLKGMQSVFIREAAETLQERLCTSRADEAKLEHFGGPVEQQHHFFAGNKYNWCTALGWEQAVQKLASYTDNNMIKSHKRLTGGMVCVVCRIELPESAHYSISNYVPSTMIKDGKRTPELVPISHTDTIRLLDNRGTWEKH